MKMKIIQLVIVIVLLASCTAKTIESTVPAESSLPSPEQLGETNNDEAYKLSIRGSGVESEISLSLDELKSLKDAIYSADYFALNNYGTKAYFSFEGIKLSAVLQLAKLKPEAKTVTFIAGDGYEKQYEINDMLKEDYIDEQNPDALYPVIIAWKENGEDYNPADGAPFRLVIGQKEPGDINKPNWVSNIAEIVIE